MAFQFPVAPTVGQVFSPAAGVSYKWNGTGWSPMAAQAAALNPDGTVTAPGIAWSNEPSAGWYRGPNLRSYAWGGGRTEALYVDPAAPGNTTFLLNSPLASGAAQLSLVNGPPTASVYRILQLRTASTGHQLSEALGGGASALPLSLDFPAGVTSTGPVRHPDGTAAAPGISWSSDSTSGFYKAGAESYEAVINGTTSFTWGKNVLYVPVSSSLSVVGQTTLANVGSTGTINATTSLGFGPNATGTHWRIVREGALVRQYFANSSTHLFTYDEATGIFTLNVDGGAYVFQNDGDYAQKKNAGQWASYSDGRIKERIEDYTPGLAEVLALRPRVFSFRAETGYDTSKRYVSLIAQEAREALPETVSATAVGKAGEMELADLLSFDPTNIQYALINAVKDLNARLTTLEANGIPVPR